ncbi:MAG: haloacid dehalogenase-like hydrolase [Candidatus Riflebacteria bacterium]|nr:haloacid dehalogenase-like hydrolase [Candidatus Riflebacteria bacterium]
MQKHCFLQLPLLITLSLFMSFFISDPPLLAQVSDLERVSNKLLQAGWTKDNADLIAGKLVNGKGEICAVFDHDGTLMNGDVTEGGAGFPGIVQDLISHNMLKESGKSKVPPEQINRIWEYYFEWREKEQFKAYAWFPTILGGFSKEELLKLAKEYYEKYYSKHLFPEMITLLTLLREFHVRIYIVSASTDILVKPAADYLGIPAENILGIRMKMNGNIVLPEIETPPSFAQGKVYYIQKFIKPAVESNLLVFGDSYSNDGPMIRYALRQGGIGVLLNPNPEFTSKGIRDGMHIQRFASFKRE